VSDPEAVEPEAVETLFGIADSVLADERERGKNLDTKTASLATFSGTILALDATLGQGLLRRDLGCVGDVALPLFFLLAAGALLVAAGVAIFGVLSPQGFLGLDDHQVRDFARKEMLSQPKVVIQGRMLSTLTDELIRVERERNEKKVCGTKWSAGALGVGLLSIAGQAVTLGLHELGV
jgi:hypothetical protein